MKTGMYLLIASTLLLQLACNQNTQSEKEIALLKKENELLKKEQELKSQKNNTEESAENNDDNENHPNSQQKEERWNTFQHKYGILLELPDYFKKDRSSYPGIQFYKNKLDRNTELFVETGGAGSMETLNSEYQEMINSEIGIDYKVIKNNWFVVSGETEEGIYYYRTLLKNGKMNYLVIRYPFYQKELFDKILPRISKSFN